MQNKQNGTTHPPQQHYASTAHIHTPVKDANAKARAIKAVQLRTQGLTYSEIAARCGYTNGSGAFKAVNRELTENSLESVEELRTAELTMLNAMQSEIWPLMMDKTNKGRLFAADRILAISERRSRLMGLDTPSDKSIFANQIIIREAPPNLLEAIQQGAVHDTTA